MLSITHGLILFGVGIFAGILNVTAGGGSMLTVPVLIFLGVDPLVANGTNRIGIVVQNAFAIAGFKTQKQGDLKVSLKLAAAAVPGAFLGAFIAAHVSNQAIKELLPAVLIFSGIALFFPIRKFEGLLKNSPWRVICTFFVLFLIGFYGGFIQIGVGFLFMAGLRLLFGMDLVRTNAHKVVIIFLYTVPALFIFAINGEVRWLLGLVLAAGTAIGAIAGTRITVKGGEKWIRWIAACSVLAITAKLIMGLIAS